MNQIDLDNFEYKPGWADHWAHCFLMGLSIFAALWQHGDAKLTITTLALLLPVSLLFHIPKRFLGEGIRKFFQFIVISCALGWGAHRVMSGVLPDKFLIESLSLLGVSLLIRGRHKDYAYMTTVCIVLTLYGAVVPRESYIYVLPFIFTCGLFAAYFSRSRGITGDHRTHTPKGGVSKNWHLIALHFLLATALSAYFYTVIPVHGQRVKGFIPTSFMSDTEEQIPGTLDRWFKDKQVRISKTGQLETIGDDPNVLGENGAVVEIDNQQDSMSISQGEGSGPPGDDLLFRVKCPLKLYWLCQLYDMYDGEVWTSTKALKYATLPHRKKSPPPGVPKSIRQTFIVEKWNSPALPAAFIPYLYELRQLRGKVDRTFFNCRLAAKTKYPRLPFMYHASSTLSYFDENPPPSDDYWPEKTKKIHYLRLPQKKISTRVRNLANTICSDIHSQYDKAIALRNYLRDNFTYKLEAKPVPPGKEAVDYFLFELREGHCEYFASTLAIMARSVGLPARVATGYSPGNYNTLTKYFDVREYHAHAWTQIFIDGYGWLTFDATPPSAIISRTTPLGIGSLHDPFGDEWRVKPPELTEITQQYLKPKEIKIQKRLNLSAMKKEQPNKVLTFLSKIPVNEEEIKESIESIEKTFGAAKKGKGWSLTNIYGIVKENTLILWRRVIGSFRYILRLVTSENGLLTIGLCLVFVILWATLPKFLFQRIRRYRRIRKCRAWMQFIQQEERVKTETRIAISYRITREMLILAGWPRKNNVDLFDYGESLNKYDMVLGEEATHVFSSYSKTVYSIEKPTYQESVSVFESALKIRDLINTIKGKRLIPL